MPSEAAIGVPVVGPEAAQQLPQLAPEERIDARRADAHRAIGLRDRPGTGQLGQPPPLLGMRAGYASLGQPGQLHGCLLPGDVLRPRIAHGGAQLCDQARQMHAARRRGNRALTLDRIQLVQEAGGLFVLPDDRRDDQPATSAGDGDVEQPPLLGQLWRERRDAARVPPGDDIDEQLRTEQRAPLAQIGPRSFLDVGYADEIPFQPLAGMCGEDLNGVGIGVASEQRVPGNLLGSQMLQKLCRRRLRQPIGETGGCREQREHGIQIPVACGTGTAACLAGPLPGSGQPGWLPDRPEHVLRAGTGGHRRTPRREHTGDPLDRTAQPSRQPGGVAGIGEHGREEHVIGLAGCPCEPSQLATQPAQRERITAPDRPEEQLLGDVLDQRVRAQHAPQRGNQVRDRGKLGQRQILATDRDRHAGGCQRPPQHRQRRRRRSDDHGHARPGHRVLEVRAP